MRFFQFTEDAIPQFPVQYGPHMGSIPVGIGEHESRCSGNKILHRRKGYTGQVNASKSHLFHYGAFISQFPVAVYINANTPAGLCVYLLGKKVSGLGGGMILRLVICITQHQFRLFLGRRRTVQPEIPGRHQSQTQSQAQGQQQFLHGKLLSFFHDIPKAGKM